MLLLERQISAIKGTPWCNAAQVLTLVIASEAMIAAYTKDQQTLGLSEADKDELAP